MVRPMHFHSANEAWKTLAKHILNYGTGVAPRGLKTLEISHATLSFDMHVPVIACRDRKLSHRFMAAEPLWYLSGSDRLEEIAKYNPRMREFSDDGETLYGAYGPPIKSQLDHVISALLGDRHTRQAWLSIWKPNPRKSKDIPCTIALGWRISTGALHCHAYMRSSDTYLGVPYDWFSFCVLSAFVACFYNRAQSGPAERVRLGHLYFTAASSHVYSGDEKAIRKLLSTRTKWVQSPVLMPSAIASGSWTRIEEGLVMRRNGLEPVATLFDCKPKWKGK